MMYDFGYWLQGESIERLNYNRTFGDMEDVVTDAERTESIPVRMSDLDLIDSITCTKKIENA